MIRLVLLLISWLALGILYPVIAQENQRIELIKANALEGVTIDGAPVRKLIGDVVFRQGTALMYCDSAYQYISTGQMDAFGHVQIVQSDSERVTGDFLHYYGSTKMARVTNNVVLVKGTSTLYTEILDYDMQNDIMYYFDGGRIVDGQNTLTSTYGNFNRKTDVFSFRENVVADDPDNHITTDTMQYYSKIHIIYLRGPSKIKSRDGNTITSNEGEYDSKNKRSNFSGRTTIEYGFYTLTGNKVYYDEKNKLGRAYGDVVIVSMKDSLTILGEVAIYRGNNGFSKVYDNAVAKLKSGADTLYIRADTLITIFDTVKKEKRMFAFHHTRIFKSDMQGICDSLVHDMIDSVTYFFRNPVLWSGRNQITGDTIRMYMVNKKLDHVVVRNKSFVISQDTLKNFNQVRGKNLIAYMVDNKINRIELFEDCESIYYNLEGDTAVSGLNAAKSKNMRIRFNAGKLKSITFLVNPEAKLIPLHEIKPEDERLKGYKWKIKDRPVLSVLLAKTAPTATPPDKKRMQYLPDNSTGRKKPKRK